MRQNAALCGNGLSKLVSGWQKKPSGKVREEKEAITPQTFYTRYIKTSRPAVFRGIIKHTPVVEKWEQDDYLKKE